MVDVPPLVDGAFANVTGPGVALSGFTSTTTLCVDGEMKAGRRFACALPRAGQCIVKLTGTRAFVCALRLAGGTARPPPAQALAPNASAAANAHARAIIGSFLA